MFTYSVTRRAKTVQQPHGGYLPLSRFAHHTLEDGFCLKAAENIPASIMGQTVDYMSRLVAGLEVPEHAFQVSLFGAMMAGCPHRGAELLSQIHGLDDASLSAACKLSSYDAYFRSPNMKAVHPVEPGPNHNTLFNIRLMITRMVRFLSEYGPVIESGFTMEGGYTDIVSSGDGDFLTEDTLWDVKTSKFPPKSSDTLQVLMYYIMGKHSWNDCFQTIQNIGIMNPRLNQIWLLNTNMIPPAVIQNVKKDVIGY